jgi:class 3 adenylate cyclase
MSRFARPLSTAEVDAIGSHAAQRNRVDGITGALLTLGSVFFQIIEGDDSCIDDLYSRVLNDDRHTDIICLRTELNVDDRLFPDWSMNVFDLDSIGGEVVVPLKLLLGRMSEAQHIIERYTQPAVSRIMTQGLNPLDVPLKKVDRLVLFTDMVGFSSISDTLPVEAVSEVVTAYLEACSVGISRRGGEVTKFLGDGVMAYFDASCVDDALESCVDIEAELRRIRDAATPKSALGLVYSGFGLAVGPVIEGSMGSSVKMDYTIIGEPVNSAARVEALTRTLDRPILMTQAVANAAGPTWDIDPVGAFEIGRDTPTPVCALRVGTGAPFNMGQAVTDSLAVVSRSAS